jgi:hypothetical protein
MPFAKIASQILEGEMDAVGDVLPELYAEILLLRLMNMPYHQFGPRLWSEECCILHSVSKLPSTFRGGTKTVGGVARGDAGDPEEA